MQQSAWSLSRAKPTHPSFARPFCASPTRYRPLSDMLMNRCSRSCAVLSPAEAEPRQRGPVGLAKPWNSASAPWSGAPVDRSRAQDQYLAAREVGSTSTARTRTRSSPQSRGPSSLSLQRRGLGRPIFPTFAGFSRRTTSPSSATDMLVDALPLRELVRYSQSRFAGFNEVPMHFRQLVSRATDEPTVAVRRVPTARRGTPFGGSPPRAERPAADLG